MTRVLAGDEAVGRWWLRLWVAALTLAVAAPVLRPGYVLSFDAVAVPRQTFLPDTFGAGEALPRAVPAEAITVALTHLVDGQWVQKALLLSCLLVAGLGAADLVPTRRRAVAAVAATAYVWNPFVAERLVIGHWWLLLGYAVLPWLVSWTARAARGTPGALPALVVLLAVGSLVPSAGLLSCLVVLVMTVACSDWRSAGPAFRRVGSVTGLAIALQTPWWLPGLFHEGSAAGESVTAFAARAEPGLGVVGSVLGLGGLWNAEAVPTSRGLPAAVAGTAIAVLGVAYGLRPLRRRFAGGEATGLLTLGGLGLLLSLWTSTPWGAAVLETLTTALPAFGLLRDAQKFVALWALPLCLLVALAAGRLSGHVRDRLGSRAVLVAAVALPLVVLPDLAWGVGGRLVPVPLPPAWSTARDTLTTSDEPGDVLVLPWGAFRRFDFNDGRTSLDPAPRWLPRPSVVDGRLVVGGTANGGVTILSTESGRSGEVERLLASGEPGVPALAEMGIGWVVVERGTPGEIPVRFLDGTDLVLVTPELELRRVPSAAAGPGWSLPESAVVVGADLAWLLLVLASGIVVLRAHGRRLGTVG